MKPAIAGTQPVPATTEAIDLHDRVRTPDGRVGEVIGFYRRDEVTVCVLFDSGDTGQFLHGQLSQTL